MRFDPADRQTEPFAGMYLHPFGSVQSCPMCQLPISAGFSVKFSTDPVMDVGNGEFVSINTVGGQRVPHLEKHCGRCGYGWLEFTAAASSSKTTP